MLDFVTLDDALALHRATPTARRPHRRDPRLLTRSCSPRASPRHRGIGLVPVVTTTVTEPFLVSTQIATLDFVSGGRAAGWRAWRRATGGRATRGGAGAVARGAACGGARARRGRAPAVGQLGGRRGDPRRRRHRFVDRPRSTTSTSRARASGPRAVDHAAPAAGPARRARDRARPRGRSRPRRTSSSSSTTTRAPPGRRDRLDALHPLGPGARLRRHAGGARRRPRGAPADAGCCRPPSRTTCPRSRAGSCPSCRRAASRALRGGHAARAPRPRRRANRYAA